jgi:hypothetical protein
MGVSRRNAWYREALEVADTSQGYVLYVLTRAAWTPDAAQL